MSIKEEQLIFRLTWLALLISLISLALFSGVIGSHGDTGTGLWIVLFLLLLYVSGPLHVIILIVLLLQLTQGKARAFRWVYFYFLLSLSGHLLIAASYGAFDELSNDITQFKRSLDEPAQIKLEKAFQSGTVSRLSDVQDALANGADANGGILEKRIPFLLVAAKSAHTELIKILVDAGADPNLRAQIDYGLGYYVTLKQPLALDIVSFSENSGVLDSIQLLLDAGADPSQSIIKLGACRRGDLPLYKLAIIIGAKGELDANNQTCLHHAAATNQTAILNALLFEPAYTEENAIKWLQSSNKKGQYPLDTALQKKNYEAALVIVKAGGKTNRKWNIERLFKEQSDNSSLHELKILLRSEH